MVQRTIFLAKCGYNGKFMYPLRDRSYKRLFSHPRLFRQLLESEAYIYILLEFQSTVTWFMVVRLLHYLSSFWLDYAENQPKQKKLPAVFPILLYSGEEKWTASTDLFDCSIGTTSIILKLYASVPLF
jgi:hypothetical protein